MEDYFELLKIDSSVLTVDEIQIINDWYNNHTTEDDCISLRSANRQEEYKNFSFENKELLRDYCILWEDEQNFYAGICINGIMRGTIFFFEFDAFLPVPAFRNISNFFNAVRNEEITDLFPPRVSTLSPEINTFDYPSGNRTSTELDQDNSVANLLWNEARAMKAEEAINTIISFIQIAVPRQIPKLRHYLSCTGLIPYILGIYRYYGYQEDVNVLLKVGKENEEYREILKEMGAKPKRLLWIEKW